MLGGPWRKRRADRGRHARERSGGGASGPRRLRRIALGVAIVAAAAGVVIAGTTTSPTATATQPGATADQPSVGLTSDVTVDTSGAAEGTLDDNYVGLSFGTNLLNTGQFDNVGNLAELLKNLGTSDMRFGGIVADQNFSGITPQALAALARLTKASGWSVIYTENIAQFDAPRVAADAAAVSKALGGSLLAFACGNEPEFFQSDGVRPKDYTVGDYLSDAANCMEAIDTGDPNAPIEGPDTVTEPTWPTAYAANEVGMIKLFGIHFYPLPCGLNGETPAERAAELFSQSESNRETGWFNWAAADAKSDKAQLWMTEVNTACGGGDPGLSNTFASALWVVDYLLSGAEHGVSGMNVQGSLTACKGYQGYSPLCEVSTNEYAAEPIYYGMLFTHLLGTGELLPVTVSGGDIVAFALKSATGGIHVILENLGKQQAVVGLSAPNSTSSATVLHLSAPSLLATSGVNIQGATVGANGSIKPGAPDTVQCSAGDCPIRVAPYSAALIDLP